jgi:DNA-binding NtrC family response regulator
MEQGAPRILVVDDEPDIGWILEQTLRPVGCAVTTTMSGKKALELVADEAYAVAFVDAKLPDLDGLELAALMRKLCPRTAVILISGYFYQEDGAISEGLQQGLFFGFVAKPFHLREVREMARQAIEQVREKDHGESLHFAGG